MDEERRENEAVEENRFLTTDLPEEEKLRRNTARKRMLFLVLALILLEVGVIAWEIVEICMGGF